ncbi:hypothetical protein ACFP63_06035 [Oerskovia jenensis]|uniref:Uncharacterized protein n=1 Tax=Oerskovia jenensis TaxID=162169 RepID=A0ABS2LGP6_9CELL|nr:hypothetical protein [Oerskovia jenensis]MBM7479605.1 hypothetical protein [Oerskovia jenensis]
MHALALDALTVVASSSEEEGAVKVVVVVVLLLAGPLFYWFTWARYRNTGKRHDHRRDTKSVTLDESGSDTHVRRVTGRSNSSMNDANHLT